MRYQLITKERIVFVMFLLTVALCVNTYQICMLSKDIGSMMARCDGFEGNIKNIASAVMALKYKIISPDSDKKNAFYINL